MWNTFHEWLQGTTQLSVSHAIHVYRDIFISVFQRMM